MRCVPTRAIQLICQSELSNFGRWPFVYGENCTKKWQRARKKNVAGAKKLGYIKNELMALHSVRRGVEGELHVITVG
jgi:hypothetical protein